jgi:hypothetical protein
MAYFDPNTGMMITGQRMGGGRAASGNEIAIAVQEAVARCQHKKYGSAKKELERLFKTYPQLKSGSWPVGGHPVCPLIELFAQEVLG